MKRTLIGILIGLVAGIAAMWWLRRPVAAGETAKAEAGMTSDAPKDDPLQLSAAQRSAAGIVLAKPEQRTLARQRRGFGRVLDPTPFVALVAEKAAAEAAARASGQELERVRKLFAAEGNASAQAMEAAEAVAARDEAAAESARVRLLAGWGRTLAGADLARIRDTLAGGAAIVRIDLLPGDDVAGAVTTARVSLPLSAESFDMEVLGPAPIADSQVQGVSYLALLRGHTLPSGATLQVDVPAGPKAEPALFVPRTAIVYHEGSAWVFVRKNDRFERRRVGLGRSVGAEIEVTEGLAATDEIATRGAQQLLSAELISGSTPNQR